MSSQHTPRYKDGVDISSIKPEHRYLYEDFSQFKEQEAQAQSHRSTEENELEKQEAFTPKMVVVGTIAITVMSWLGYKLLIGQGHYSCYRGRCMNSHAAGLLYFTLVGFFIWFGWRGFKRRFLAR